jgi:glutathione S-transferase
MKIHGDLGSGNCLKVKYTADFLKRSYSWVPVDITKGESRKPQFLMMNPMGQVPVMELDDGRALAQSNAITIADISLVAYTRLAHEGGFDLASRPGVRSWIARVEARLGIAAARPAAA